MNRKITTVGLFVTALFFVSSSFAADLIDVYRDALRNDPVFKAATTTYYSSKEALPQARAALLPQLLGTGTLTRNRQNNGAANAASGAAGTQVFTQHNFTAQLSQTIFNYANWIRVKTAAASVKQAQATFNASAQELIIRVADAYFNVLQAKDNLRFTQSELRANERQLEQARQRFKVGLDAITSVYNAQAAYDAVAAQKIADENEVANRREALREITGELYRNLSGLRGKLPLVRPVPNDQEAWVSVATRQNYVLLAARYAAVAARENIKVNAAGNFPTADFTSSYNDTGNTRPFPATSDTTTANLGVSLNFPVFQGGLVLSQTRQAKYDYQTASYQMDSTYRSTSVTTRQTFNSVVAGISKIKADRQAVKSAQSSLDSSEAAFKVGTRTIVDVLDDQKNLYDAQRTLAIDQYTYIRDILTLKQAAGTLSVSDLEHINSWLATRKRYRGPSALHTGKRADIKKLQKRRIRGQKAKTQHKKTTAKAVAKKHAKKATSKQASKKIVKAVKTTKPATVKTAAKAKAAVTPKKTTAKAKTTKSAKKVS